MTKMQVRKKSTSTADPTSLSLMVESATQQTLEEFNITHIVNALQAELHFTEERAYEIAADVQAKLHLICEHAGLKSISTSLIRSVVNTILHEKGTKSELKSAHDINIPFYDITNIIENANNENGNLEHNPESINFTLAERIKKEYAFKYVYTKDATDAHLAGKIHIHDLGAIDRAYCSGHNPAYLLLNGIKGVPNILSTSAPANSAWTLARHLCSMTQFYSSMFAGAIGWDFINGFFAPLMVGWSQKKMKQLAQTLIFDLSQLAGAKGGQTSFTDFNVYITIPQHYRETLAIGRSGKFFGWTNSGEEVYFNSRQELAQAEKHGDITAARYRHFEKEAQAFAKALLSVIEEGDASGLPFAFPKINLHVNEDTFTKPIFVQGKGYLCTKNEKAIYYKTWEQLVEATKSDYTVEVERCPNIEAQKILQAAAKASAKSGCPYFIFDRNAASVSQCCRLKIDFSEEDMQLMHTPEELRFVGVQNVSINLPNAALESAKNWNKLEKEIERRMRIAMKAHVSRTKYLESLMAMPNGPLKFYTRGMDGKPYVNLKKGSYLIGIVGLNECIYNMLGVEMHMSQEAYLKGLEIVSFMKNKTDEFSKEFNMSVKLEETPAESTAMRFATLDTKKYGMDAFVKSNTKGIYYTNSIHFSYDAPMDFMERLQKQSAFHTMVDAGSMIHLWVGEKLPDPKAIYSLVEHTWRNTPCVQWVISPEYTTCVPCNKTYVGLHDTCPKCNGLDIFHMTRITGYYVKTEKFNKGKQAELKDRNRDAYNIKEVNK